MHQKGFANIVLIGALVVLLGIGGYFVWSKKEKTEPFVPENSQVDTSDWKTYTNDKFGFEIQLPNDWHIEQTTNSISFNSQEQREANERDKKAGSLEGNPTDITLVYYYNILNSKSLEEYVKLNQDIFTETSEISFAGQKAFRGREAGLYDINAIWVQKNNHLYKIWQEGGLGMDSQLSAQILSTFKFTK